jgi:ketosteroid isomerase-like protein
VELEHLSRWTLGSFADRVLEPLRFEDHDILSGDDRAVIADSLASKLERNGKFVKTDSASVLTVANREIVRIQMRKVSFAVSPAARD